MRGSSSSSPPPSAPVRIALAGPMGSGKTFVAEWLRQRYSSLDLQRIGFGDEVKRLVQELWDPPKKDRALLVEFATSMRAIDPAIWVKRLLARADAAAATHWVCDDLRQDNELAALRERGWLLVRILVPEDVRRQRLRTVYPDDYEEHMAYAQHRTEQDMLHADAAHFACTIDTSDGGMWCELLEKVIYDRWGLRPSPMMATPPASPDGSARTTPTVDGPQPWEWALYALSTVVGVGSWMWMLHTMVHDAHAANLTLTEVLAEWSQHTDY